MPKYIKLVSVLYDLVFYFCNIIEPNAALYIMKYAAG